jgi:hypothetical protein
MQPFRQRDLAELQHQFRPLRQVEGQVRGGGGVGHQTAQGAGAREQQAEASLCRHGAGECGAEGGPRNKTRTPAERREVATHLVTQGGLPVQRACQAVGLGRAMYYRPVVNWAQRDAPVIEALTTLGATKPRWGFWK